MERKTLPRKSPKRDQYLETALSLHEKGVSVRCIGKIIGVSKTLVHKWIRNFADETRITEEKMDIKPNLEPQGTNMEELSSSSPEDQIAKLKEALRRAELRADLYDEMINVAEAKFKVAIRKKAGAKQ